MPLFKNKSFLGSYVQHVTALSPFSSESPTNPTSSSLLNPGAACLAAMKFTINAPEITQHVGACSASVWENAESLYYEMSSY